MQTQHLIHKHGGTITQVHGVGHRTDDGVPWWFFICDVSWDDGGKSARLEVAPDRLCADQSNADAMVEINAATKALSDYLIEHGRWLKKAKWVKDHLIHWTPRRPKHELAI